MQPEAGSAAAEPATAAGLAASEPAPAAAPVPAPPEPEEVKAETISESESCPSIPTSVMTDEEDEGEKPEEQL